MTNWLRDFHYGARMLVKRPGTSTIAIVALALGIGLTTVMFSIVQGAILRGLPFDEGDRLMLVSRARLAEPDRRQSVSRHDFVDWREMQRTFEDLAAFTTTSRVVTGDSGYPEQYRVAQVTPNLMSLLRIQPVIGRDLTDADAVPGAPPVALISHRMWTSRFGGDPAVLGRDIRLSGAGSDAVPTRVIGVMPEDFGFPQTQEAWVPLDTRLPDVRGRGTSVRVIGRLADDVSVREASAEMAGIAARLAAAHPENAELTARVGPYVQESIGDDVVATLFTMLGAVFGVMLIACVNVTNLQLARAAERTKEVAIRTALGSGRWRIIRQLLAEGLILATVGALLGLGLAHAGTRAFMRAIVDTQPPFWIDVRVDPTVLLFVVGVTMAAAIVSSVLPGWRVAATDSNAVLKDETRGATGLRMGAFSRWLVVVEVTASCVLLVVSGLMIRSIVATSRLDYPFATEDVFVARVNLMDQREAPERALQLEELEQRVARIPGVRRAALAQNTPGSAGRSAFRIEGEPEPPEGQLPTAGLSTVSPAYFDVLRVQVRDGRGLADTDRHDSEPVVVVDDAFVSEYFGGAPPLGRRIRFGTDNEAPAPSGGPGPAPPAAPSAPWMRIVGVVPSLVDSSDTGRPTPVAYRPISQSPSGFALVVASTTVDPSSISSAVRDAVVELSPQSPVMQPGALADQLWQEGWPFRVFGGLFLMFGLAALLLAAAGLYGVMSFSVRRRTQEIGVRMALGAPRSRVLLMVLWQGLWRVALGVALGIVPGWFVATMMEALLENTSPTDPVVHGTTVVTLLVAGALACLAPAQRAASVDPLTALRHE